MASSSMLSHTSAYQGQIHKTVHTPTQQTYYRYVILSEFGQELYDGCAGDEREAEDSVKAHIRFLTAQAGNRVPA